MESQTVSQHRRHRPEFVVWSVVAGLLVLAIVVMLLGWS